jgi:hypothetical protein
VVDVTIVVCAVDSLDVVCAEDFDETLDTLVLCSVDALAEDGLAELEIAEVTVACCNVEEELRL